MPAVSIDKPLTIFDTSLRDGEQAPGNAMSLQQKLRIARELEALGVNTIEAGFPAASDNDFAAVRAIADAVRGAKICAFARASSADIERAAKAVENAAAAQIEILGVASEIHLLHKRQITRQQALDEIAEAVRLARRIGFEDICVAPEDATRADPEFLGLMCELSAQAGATMILIPDTVGCLLPGRVPALIETVRARVPAEVRVAMHAHDDLGLAVANTLAAIEAGIDEIQVTLCGIGERAGNCALEEVVAALTAHPAHFGRSTTIDVRRVYAACQMLIDSIRLPIARGKAVIGENAFATAAGIHQAAIIRNPQTYEFLDPAMFGAERRMVISRHSGRHALKAKIEAFGLAPTPGLVEHIYRELTASEEPVCSDSRLRALVLQNTQEIAAPL
ncbi:2-isopropylmalate synthase [Inquilinus limosus]|uniref:LeuA family protein n=1 Tax=Inquilinus limosus TaxID=171674 RepID=UPI003F175E82